MNRLQVSSGSFRTQSGSFDSALHPPGSLLGNQNKAGTLDGRKKAKTSFRSFIPHIKGGKPFTGLFTRLKRKNQKCVVPSLNFAQTHSELLIELAYTASLLRQTIRPDNRDHLVSQLSELIRMIRGRVASGAACIQPVAHSPVSSSSVLPAPSSSNRSAMEKLSRFHEAYMGFVDWLNELSTAELQDSAALCLNVSGLEAIESGGISPPGEDFDPLDPNSELSVRGQQLFIQFKNASLAVFDVLKACGFTTLMDPGQLESMVHRSVHLKDCSSNNGTTESPIQRSSESGRAGCSVLTEADRALLAKLWSHFDTVCAQTSPPPKPPLLGLNQDTPQLPTLTTPSSSVSIRPAPNPVDDPEFAAYLKMLANALQLDVPNQSHHSSIPPDGFEPVSSRPPLPASFIRKSSVDLNAPDRLDFPLVDASDESDTDYDSQVLSASRRSNSTTCLGPNTLTKPTTYPHHFGIPLTYPDDQSKPLDRSKSQLRPYSFESDAGLWPATGRPSTDKLTPGHRQKQWSISHPADPANPLDDQNMQENIAIVAMRLQRAHSGSELEPLENPLCTFTQDPSSGGSAGVNHCMTQEPDQWDGTEPVYFSEVKADTEEDSELIEANGKKYRRHFQRHITIERHKVKQVIVAPSLPDGSGPDWSRAVLSANQSTDPSTRSAPNCTQNPHAPTTVLDSSLARESGAYSGSPTSDLDHSRTNTAVDETRGSRSRTTTATNSLGQLSSTETGRCETELSDDFDWDSDDPSGETQTFSPPPPKPPVPQALILRHGKRPLTSYMFRFGSSYYDDPERDRRLSNQLFDFFRTNWHKEEASTGPHEKSKIISYVEQYTQQTPVGDIVHRSTCVQHTCTVRMLGGLEGLRAQRGYSDASIEEKLESVASSSPNLSSSSVLTYKSDQPLSPDTDSASCELLQPNLLDTSGNSNDLCNNRVSYNRYDTTAPETLSSTSCGTGASDLPTMKSLANSGTISPPRTPSSEILGLVRADEYLLWGESDNAAEKAVHAGCVDALIVHLTSFGKLMPSFFLFYETFLFTYRAFLTPEDLIERLIHRYTLFRAPKNDSDATSAGPSESVRSKVCSSTASTLVTVVSRLKTDLTVSVQHRLMQFSELLIADNYVSLNRLLTTSIQNQLTTNELHISTLEDCANSSQTRSYSSDQTESNRSLNSLTLSDCSKEGDDDPVASIAVTDDGRLKHPEHTATLPKINIKSPRGLSNTISVSARNSFIAAELDRLTLNPSRPSMVSGLYSTSPRGLRRKSASPAPSSSTTLSVLSFSAQDLAEQLTYLEAEKYYQIQISELLDIPNLERGKAPSVAECALHFSSVCNWATFQMLAVAPTERDKLANRFLDVMEHLHKLQNFSSYLSILCAFLLVPESLFSRKTRGRLGKVKPYMQPPYFSEYRRELEAAKPPFIPYLGLMMQNLIMLAQANPLWYDKPPEELASTYQAVHGPIVNFWRCWKHFLIIHFIVKQEKMDIEKARYHIKPNPEILRFLDNFKDSMSEADLRRLANRMRRDAT